MIVVGFKLFKILKKWNAALQIKKVKKIQNGNKHV